MVAIGAALVAITATLAVKAEVRSSSGASLRAAHSSFAATAKRAHVIGRQLFVEGELFEVRGICYSPVPINESVYFAPYGDYFTPEYSFIWLRDLPLIKAMGVNLVRIYGWSPHADHSMFLDALHAHGLKLMATFYMGDATETPVGTLAQRKQVIEHFRNQVKQYASHPALLFWSFGNELNGIWNGFLQQLANAHEHGEQPCGYDESFDDKGGCWVHSMGTPRPGSDCAKQTYCVYSRLFGFIEEATKAAKSVADVLVVSAFADVDSLYDKVARAGHVAPSVDAWTSQVYRGASFGDFFANMTNATDKPILLTEYGVDAFHDECGTGDQTPCYNTLSSPHSHEDEHAQAVFARNLTREWSAQSSARKGCEHARRGSPNCTTAGAILMSWADEYWKGAKAQAACQYPYTSAEFSPELCDRKAHVTCGNWNASDHDLCGYWLEAAPDHYVNEEWFGITAPSRCGDKSAVNALRPRETYWLLRKLWAGLDKDEALFAQCDDVLEAACSLPDEASAKGGHLQSHPAKHVAVSAKGFGVEGLEALLRFWRRLTRAPARTSGGTCTGHGACTTQWELCGSGSDTISATPCCSCDAGFAGVACEQVDARVFVAVAAAAVLLLQVMLMVGGWALKWPCLCRRTGNNSGLKEELIPKQ